MEEIIAEFSIDEEEEIEVEFILKFTPEKLSDLENDMKFIRKEDVEIPKLQLMTESDYEALETKEATTLYLIEEENA